MEYDESYNDWLLKQDYNLLSPLSKMEWLFIELRRIRENEANCKRQFDSDFRFRVRELLINSEFTHTI